MPNKEAARSGALPAVAGSVTGPSVIKPAACVNSKPPLIKIEVMSSPPRCVPSSVPASPAPPGAGAGGAGAECTAAVSPVADELLGSLTTQQQQRTSARVIKKLRLDSLPDDVDKRDALECIVDKQDADKDTEGKGAGGKQRMPKALWSSDEKSLFFEALNEYGKDFDAITAYIRAKMKRKGVSGKNKSQVSHFYYRTWHKLSKHTTFGENVKKVAQELYALINYGEMRRKMAGFMTDRTCARLQELITRGTVLVRARGRSLRLRTPQCRALRALNSITECAAGVRVPTRVTVVLRARNMAAWARVQAAAHNPRVALSAPLRVQLATMLQALAKRWHLVGRRDEDNPYSSLLHVGPRAGLELQVPTVTASEQTHAHKICFASYLERISTAPDTAAKIRTPKRQRKDSGTERDNCEKRARSEAEGKSGLDIEELAIDGIELMATLSTERDSKLTDPHEIKPDSDDIKPEEPSDELRGEDTDTDEMKDEVTIEDLKDIEKDGFSEEECCYDTDEPRRNMNTSRNLKVKFRISTKKSCEATVREYTVVSPATLADGITIGETANLEEKQRNENGAETKAFHEINDVEAKPIEELNGIEKLPEETIGAEAKSTEVVRVDSKPIDEVSGVDDKIDDGTVGEEKIEDRASMTERADEQLEIARRQMARGWSVSDAGQLTLGDLYLMFGSESRLELDYWWCHPSAPLSPLPESKPISTPTPPVDKPQDTKLNGVGMPCDEGSDSELMSPRAQQYSHDSNDALSGDEKKRTDDGMPVLRLSDKLVNRPESPQPEDQQLMTLTSRLRRLLALAGGGVGGMGGAPGGGGAARGGGGACTCGHVCPLVKRRPVQYSQEAFRYMTQGTPANVTTIHTTQSEAFRYPSQEPTAIAPKMHTAPNALCLDDLPRWRRRRSSASKQVVVQRLLPLLPKPTTTVSAPNLIPVKIQPQTFPTTPVAILPRPQPAITTIAPSHQVVYVLRTNDAADVTPPAEEVPPLQPDVEDVPDVGSRVKIEVEETMIGGRHRADVTMPVVDSKQDSRDHFAGFLSSESLSIPSLSPSRLLRDADGTWLERDVHDFSLSSFLGHLEGTAPPPVAEVDTQLQCMMQESSIDYMAKFADLAAEVASDRDVSTT